MRQVQVSGKIAALLLCGALTLSGCGKDGADSVSDPVSTGKNDVVSDTAQRMNYKNTRYVPEFTDTSDKYDADMVTGVGFMNDTFYLIQKDYSDYILHGCKLIACSPDDGAEKVLWDDAGTGDRIVAAAPLQDGSCMVLSIIGDTGSEYIVRKVDAEGREISSRECSTSGMSGTQFGFVTDLQDRCYLLNNQCIILLDGQGEISGKIDLSGKIITDIVCGSSGQVYVYERMTNQFFPVDFETAGLTASPGQVPVNMGGVTGTTGEADLLMSDGATVYRYGCEDRLLTPLFDLSDSQISGASDIVTIGEMKDGRIFLFSVNGGQHATEMALLTPKALAECADKINVTVGIAYTDDDLLYDVAYFNRLNEDFSISIVNYCVGGRSYWEAWEALKLDISIGKGPDICFLDDYGEAEALFSGGYFADLSDYLNGSRQYQKEDFFSQALDAYTWQGQLLAIPKYFRLQTIVGKADVVGETMGWDMEELKAVIRNHPDAWMVFADRESSSVLDMCGGSILEQFVDFDAGRADFDSAAYIDFLEFLTELPDNFNENEAWSHGNEWLREEKALLSYQTIWEYIAPQRLAGIFDGEYTCIGYPSSDKTPVSMIQCWSVYGITAGSPEKDRAWRFIEWLNSGQGEERYDRMVRSGFPTRIDVFEREARDEMDKTDEESHISQDLGGGVTVNYRSATAEEIRLLYSLIEGARPERSEERIVLEILREEAAYLSDGGKSAKEVAEVTQNRIQLYLDERK